MPLYRAARFLLILCLAICAPTLPASAQGTDGVFPDPLDWNSFQSILVPLDLSSEQIGALEAAHSNYLESMMNLRDGAIAEFMEGHDRWYMAGDQDADATTERINDFRRITARFESNESNLFDETRPSSAPPKPSDFKSSDRASGSGNSTRLGHGRATHPRAGSPARLRVNSSNGMS